MKRVLLLSVLFVATSLFAKTNISVGNQMVVSKNDGNVSHVVSDIDSIRFENAYIDTVSLPRMKLIPSKGKTFRMGDSTLWGGAERMVTFTYDFYMDSIEVRQNDYNEVMLAAYADIGFVNLNWKYATGARISAYSIRWVNAVLYCNALSNAHNKDSVYKYESITGNVNYGETKLNGFIINMNKNGFRLPTEAEWEFACRAGSTTDFFWGKDYLPYPETTEDSLEFDSYVRSRLMMEYLSTHTRFPSGTKKPNAFGLYDMVGNEWEWANDLSILFSTEPVTDPISENGDGTGISRIARGGSAMNIESIGLSEYNSSFRINVYPRMFNYAGFRVVYRKFE